MYCQLRQRIYCDDGLACCLDVTVKASFFRLPAGIWDGEYKNRMLHQQCTSLQQISHIAQLGCHVQT